MSNINSKIIFLRGEKGDLPEQLDSGELAFTTDDGTLVIGTDNSFGKANIDRTEFPYRNIEILTERSEETFADLHGDRMREGTEFDYYECRLEPDRLAWTPVLIDNDGEYYPYQMEILNSVSAFVDYVVTENETAEPIRDGQMIVWQHDALGTTDRALFTDKSSMPRDRNLTNPSNYDPRQVFEKVKFRFRISDDRRYINLEYKNYTFDLLCLQFRVSRPLDGGSKNVLAGRVIVNAALVGIVESPQIETEGLWRIGGHGDATHFEVELRPYTLNSGPTEFDLSPSGTYGVSKTSTGAEGFCTFRSIKNSRNYIARDVVATSSARYLIGDNGVVYQQRHTGTDTDVYTIADQGAGAITLLETGLPNNCYMDRMFNTGASEKIVFVSYFDAYIRDSITGLQPVINSLAAVGINLYIMNTFQDTYGDIWGICQDENLTEGIFYLWRLFDAGQRSSLSDLQTLTTGGPYSYGPCVFHDGDAYILFPVSFEFNVGALGIDISFYRFDDTTFELMLEVSCDGFEDTWFFRDVPIGASEFVVKGNWNNGLASYDTVRKISSSDLTVIAEYQLSDWKNVINAQYNNASQNISYDWVTDSLAAHHFLFGDNYQAFLYFPEALNNLITTQAFLEDGTGVYLSGRLIESATNTFADLNSFYTTSTQYTTVPYISKFDKDGVLEWQKHIALTGPAIVPPLLGRTVTYTPMQMDIRDGELQITGNYVLAKSFSVGTGINFYTIRVSLDPSNGDVISSSTHYISDAIYGIYPIEGGEIWIAGYVILRRDLTGALIWSASIQDFDYNNYSYNLDGTVVDDKIYTLGWVNEMDELAVLCLDLDRNLLWSTTWNITSSLRFNDLADSPKLKVDADGTCYVCSVWYENDEANDGYDFQYIISKFSNTGVHLWSKRIITPPFYTSKWSFTIDQNHITFAFPLERIAVVKLNKTDGSYFQRTMFSNLGTATRVEAITTVNGITGVVYMGTCYPDLLYNHVGVWRLPTAAWVDEEHRKYTVARMYTDNLETTGLTRFSIKDFDDNYQIIDVTLPVPTNTLTAKYGIGSYDGLYTEDPSDLVIAITDSPSKYVLAPTVYEREINRASTVGDQYWTGVIQGIGADLSEWDEIRILQVAVLPNGDYYAVGVLYIPTGLGSSTVYTVVYTISKLGIPLIKKKIAVTNNFTDPISCHLEADKLVIFTDTGYKLDLALDLSSILAQSQFSGLADNTNGAFTGVHSLPSSYVYTGSVSFTNNIELAFIDKSTNNVVLHKTLIDSARSDSGERQVVGNSTRLFFNAFSSNGVSNSTQRGFTVIVMDNAASSILWQKRIVFPNTTTIDVNITSIIGDESNNVYVIGTITDLVYTGPSQPMRPFYIMKLDSTGTVVFCKQYKLNDFTANWLTAYYGNLEIKDGRLFCYNEIEMLDGPNSQDYVERERRGMSFMEIDTTNGAVLWSRAMQCEEYHFAYGFFTSDNGVLNIDPYDGDLSLIYARGLIHSDFTQNYITKLMRLPIGVGTEIDDDGINMWTDIAPDIAVTDSEVTTAAGTFVLDNAASVTTGTAAAYSAMTDDIRNQVYTFKAE